MSRVKKPVDEKLVETINTPVTRGLKRRVLKVAKDAGVPKTRLTRQWIERGVETHEATK